MSATELQIKIQLLGKEVFTEAEMPAAQNETQRTLKSGKKGIDTTQDATTTPVIDSPIAAAEITLGGAPTTIDLTAVQGLVMPAGSARTLDMTGKKLKAVLLAGDAANAAVINVAPGGANPYPLFGAGNDIDVAPGEVLAKGFKSLASNLPAVAGVVKTITVSGTSGDKLYIEMYFGA